MTVTRTHIADRYRLDEKVGSGGMSSVYRAFDPTLERWVAIKMMHRDISTRPGSARALPARGARGGPAQPPARGHRDRRRRGRRHALHRARVRGGRDAQGPDPARGAAAGVGVAGVRDRDRQGALLRPRAQARAPRHQAAEHPDRPATGAPSSPTSASRARSSRRASRPRAGCSAPPTTSRPSRRSATR